MGSARTVIVVGSSTVVVWVRVRVEVVVEGSGVKVTVISSRVTAEVEAMGDILNW